MLLVNERNGALVLFFSVPIAIVALEFGLLGGIVGGTVAAALFLADALYQDSRFTTAGWLIRPVAFLTLGLVVGFLAQRIHRESDARARLARDRGELVAKILTAEDEARRDIAQSLHDGALQSLLVANQDLIEASPGRRGVAAAQEVVRGAIERVREVVAALHPVTLEHGGLDVAVAAVAHEVAARTGLQPTVHVDPAAVGEHDELVLAVVRELVANAGKHAGASKLAVSVERAADVLAIEVVDDGGGISAGRREAALREGHIGLASVEQRLAAIGGAFDVRSAPGAGTRARAEVPLGDLG